ncbi:uncharacterized protein BP5553_07147 [Venustampulla echinocandica]|uniref:Uncharacterized protein n=1 Tax=Venustampulla echinocandica TaxID=2656787 RepID=A0A370TIM6_9HELO|nr:uncharacterized protein BP5553_07147 [Venustampulla echinocandica]RDL35216.1 hypothetical protein BP5553_07147 [Venustampulla echinocandica]
MQDVLKLHKILLDAIDAAKDKGFAEDDPAEKIAPGTGDVCLNANHQIKYFNIKPLCHALIIIIENPMEQRKSHFEQELVRFVRTEWTTGLSQPISFQGLEVQRVINENEVVVLLPEAVRFIMDLDEEEALQEKQDPTMLETWLGDPEDRVTRIEKADKVSEPMWTTGSWPTGPSTEWLELAKPLE